MFSRCCATTLTALIKTSAVTADNHPLVSIIGLLDALMQARVWCDRVPTHKHMSDGLARDGMFDKDVDFKRKTDYIMVDSGAQVCCCPQDYAPEIANFDDPYDRPVLQSVTGKPIQVWFRPRRFITKLRCVTPRGMSLAMRMQKHRQHDARSED